VTRESPEVLAARIETERARARLMDTAQRLQARISPGTLASNAWQGAKEKGADMAENAVDAVRKRPIAATSVVAAIALFLAREPLKDLAGKVADGVAGKRPKRSRKTTSKSTETVA
jgi:hypothetical protein